LKDPLIFNTALNYSTRNCIKPLKQIRPHCREIFGFVNSVNNISDCVAVWAGHCLLCVDVHICDWLACKVGHIVPTTLTSDQVRVNMSRGWVGPSFHRSILSDTTIQFLNNYTDILRPNTTDFKDDISLLNHTIFSNLPPNRWFERKG
jgi:hypothetical protein